MTETEVVRKGIQEKSAETRLIENRLREAAIGEVVQYDQLTKIVGDRDVRKHCYGNIQTAMKTVLEEGLFFVTVRNQGFKRITHEEAVNAIPTHYIKRARSAAKRGIKNLKNIEFADLSEDGKKKHRATSAQLGAIDLVSSSKATKKIEGKVGDTPLTIGNTLDLFLK